MLLKLIDTINNIVDFIFGNCMLGIAKNTFGYITIIPVSYRCDVLIQNINDSGCV